MSFQGVPVSDELERKEKREDLYNTLEMGQGVEATARGLLQSWG